MEDRLLSEYIGNNAEKIINLKYNWFAAIICRIFGPVWFFYRKSYLLGFAFLFFSFLAGIIASYMGLEDASNIMFFVYLFTANKLYLWDAKRKVKKIIERDDMLEEEMISYAREKGGTSVVAVVIYSVVLLAYMVWLVKVMFSLMTI